MPMPDLIHRDAPAVPAAPTPSAVATGLPPALRRPYGVRAFLRALRHRAAGAIRLGLIVGLLVAGATWQLLPPAHFAPFTARAQLQAQPGPGEPPDAAFVTGRPVLDEVLRDPEIAGLKTLENTPDPHAFLQSRLKVETMGPGLLRASLSGEDAEEVARLVNAVAAAAVRQSAAVEKGAKQADRDEREAIQQRYEKALAARRARLQERARGLGGLESPEQALLPSNPLQVALEAREAERERIRSQLRETKAELARKEESRVSRPAEPVKPPPPAAPVAPVPTEAEYRAAQEREKQLAAEITQLERVALNTERFEAMVKERGLDRKRAEAQAVVEAYRRARAAVAAPPPPAPAPKPEPAEPSSAVAQLRSQLQSLEQQEQALTEEVERRRAELTILRKEVADVQEIKRDLLLAEEMGREISRLLEAVNTAPPSAPRLALREEAAVPTERDERRLPWAAASGLTAFAFVLVGVGLQELASRKVRRVEDVAWGLEVPVLGAQPQARHLPTPDDGPAPWYEQPRDGMDTTRALLMQESARVIVVTSAVGGEGTSSIAVHLAASLARSGRRTLLLDAHLRRPAVHDPYGLPNTVGLSEVLRGEVLVTAAVRPGPLDRLWVLPAGQVDAEAMQGLSRPGLFRLLEQFRRDYDHVVIDTAPVMPTADSLLLAQRADTVLLAVRAGTSRLPAVHAAWQRLTFLGARRVGAIVETSPTDAMSAYASPPAPGS